MLWSVSTMSEVCLTKLMELKCNHAVLNIILMVLVYCEIHYGIQMCNIVTIIFVGSRED